MRQCDKQYRITFKKIIGHLKTVVIHKYYVGKYCFVFGLYWRGITHDLSKFSLKEFIESCRYYTGERSPIDLCKEVNGASMAWLHHRGRNYHHWEMWVDNFQDGMTPIKMPFDCALEMFCDFMGAGKAYWKDKFTLQSEIDWWNNKREKVIMHESTKKLIDYLFKELKYQEGNLKGMKYLMKHKEFKESLSKSYSEDFGDDGDKS